MFTKQFFNGSHGKMSFVKIDGDIDYPTIVFMDGMGGASNYLGLKNISERIDHRYTKLFIDRLGVCESDETGVPRTWENIVFEVHELIDYVVNEPVLFFAFSASGPLALAYSTVYPKEVIGIIAIEPTTTKSHSLFQTEEYLQAIAWMEELTDEERKQLFIDPEWTEEEKLEEEHTAKEFIEGSTLHNEYVMGLKNLESISNLAKNPELPFLVFSQAFREKEYLTSEFTGNMTTYHFMEGHHHLHRVHPDEIAYEVNYWLNQTIQIKRPVK